MYMSQAKTNDRFSILELNIEAKIKKRLQDMGLTKGVEVKVLGYYGNNAYILNVRGSRIVIGKAIAEDIIIETQEDPQERGMIHAY